MEEVAQIDGRPLFLSIRVLNIAISKIFYKILD